MQKAMPSLGRWTHQRRAAWGIAWDSEIMDAGGAVERWTKWCGRGRSGLKVSRAASPLRS